MAGHKPIGMDIMNAIYAAQDREAQIGARHRQEQAQIAQDYWARQNLPVNFEMLRAKAAKEINPIDFPMINKIAGAGGSGTDAAEALLERMGARTANPVVNPIEVPNVPQQKYEAPPNYQEAKPKFNEFMGRTPPAGRQPQGMTDALPVSAQVPPVVPYPVDVQQSAQIGPDLGVRQPEQPPLSSLMSYNQPQQREVAQAGNGPGDEVYNYGQSIPLKAFTSDQTVDLGKSVATLQAQLLKQSMTTESGMIKHTEEQKQRAAERTAQLKEQARQDMAKGDLEAAKVKLDSAALLVKQFGLLLEAEKPKKDKSYKPETPEQKRAYIQKSLADHGLSMKSFGAGINKKYSDSDITKHILPVYKSLAPEYQRYMRSESTWKSYLDYADKKGLKPYEKPIAPNYTAYPAGLGGIETPKPKNDDAERQKLLQQAKAIQAKKMKNGR